MASNTKILGELFLKRPLATGAQQEGQHGENCILLSQVNKLGQHFCRISVQEALYGQKEEETHKLNCISFK